MRNIARFSSKPGVTNWQPSFMKNHRRLCERPQGGWLQRLLSLSAFPDVSQAIAKRHASFRKRQCLEGKKEQEARIRAIALHHDSVGGYPSRKRVKEVLNGPMGLNNSEVGAVLREVRTQ